MMFLPWVVFFVGIMWMLRQGFKSKAEYLRRRKAEEIKRPAMSQEGIMTRGAGS